MLDEITAKAASSGKENEYVKVRIQSTPQEISNFHKLLNKCEELGMCEVMNFSEIFRNKGTDKYFRAYTDISINEENMEGM